MTRTALNHVSIYAGDMDESIRFYETLFGMERIPTPKFEFDAVWLEMNDGRQLHLFNLDTEPPRYHHFGITVDDLEAVYTEAKSRGILTDFTEGESYTIYALPDGAVQLYVRDPSGNVVEVNWPDVTTIDDEIRSEILDRGDVVAQTGEAASASLRLEPVEVD